MRKILCITLAMAMTISIMAGCSTDNGNSSSQQVDSGLSEQTSSSSESSSSESSKAEDKESIKVESENARLAYIIDSVRDADSKEAFLAQTNNDTGVLDMLSLKEEDVTEYSITFSQLNVHAYMIAIIKPADGKEDIVTTALKEYHQGIMKSFEQYLPDQYKIASDAVLFNVAGYVGIVMCDNSDTIQANIEKALKEINNIQIVPNNGIGSAELEKPMDTEVTSSAESTESSADKKDTSAGESKNK